MKNKLQIKDSLFTQIQSPLGEIGIYSLKKLEECYNVNISKLPYAIRILIENIIRNADKPDVTISSITNILKYDPKKSEDLEIAFNPSRVLLQDFTGVACVADLAALRGAMQRNKLNPKNINPVIPVDLVVDHSIQVDCAGSHNALSTNQALEFSRNKERYEFLKWGQQTFDNFRVIPSGQGICHQINLEYLASVISCKKNKEGQEIAFPDSLVGADSHTTMINGLGVLGWGVGGIEAEVASLGESLHMLIPEVVGVRLFGQKPADINAFDITLTIVETLRKHGVVGCFVEFFGEAVPHLEVTDRATIANMAPEYGATMGFFPVDNKTLEYLKITGRKQEHIDFVETYCKEQQLFRDDSKNAIEYSRIVELDISKIKPCVAGRSRPQDRVIISDMPKAWTKNLTLPKNQRGLDINPENINDEAIITIDNQDVVLKHGSVVLASITSCTNTSNPYLMLSAGLFAKKAVEKGLMPKKFVKTSFIPGSKTVKLYLEKAGLLEYLEKLGFHIVGYGCGTCIGNSGSLNETIEKAIADKNLSVAAVVSGNRNFEGRIHKAVKANYLASPAMVIAYALAGSIDFDFENNELEKNIYLKDIMPHDDEIKAFLNSATNSGLFAEIYADVEKGQQNWQAIDIKKQDVYNWNEKSTYLQEPPFVYDIKEDNLVPINNAKVLAYLGHSITTDHISPAGNIVKSSPAGIYLKNEGVKEEDFNSYGSRRGNHHVMVRGTFANNRLKNMLTPEKEGGYSIYQPTKEILSIYDTAMLYQKDKTPLIIIAGKDYGMGSSRDWAAKGVCLLGVKAIIAESFERIHRSNLVGMGVLPLQFKEGETAEKYGITGLETFNILLQNNLKPFNDVSVEIIADNGNRQQINTVCRLDSFSEIECFKKGGILPTVLIDKIKE
ncbi:MAG: aconitate hydratase AcnA [Alphaproteobacteria bacterium]